jgi:hypothetical protein
LSFDRLSEALNAFGATIDSPWSASSLRRLAEVPWESATDSDWLLDADFRVVFLRWLAECGQPIADSGKPGHIQRARVLKQVMLYVDGMFPPTLDGSLESGRRELIRALDQVAVRISESVKSGNMHLSDLERRELLDEAGSPSRCYLCGVKFGRPAVATFLREEEPVFRATPFVDMFYPRGLNGVDLRIEIDHVRPRARGGAHALRNLRLACGYCNRVKSDSLTVLDRTRYGPWVSHPDLGRMKLPHPTWVIRMFAVLGECTVCRATTESSQLVVAPVVWSSFLNPLNLRVFCVMHDPIAQERLVAAKALRRAH